MPLASVSALVLDGLAVFEFGVICEVFGIDRSAEGVPNFDFKVCGPQPGKPLRTSVGAQLVPDHGLDALVGADVVAVAAVTDPVEAYPPEALAALRAAHESGSTILTVCSGAFVAGRRGCSTDAAAPRTGCIPPNSPSAIRPRSSTAMCCSSTTVIW
ncbi:hypothetical protein MSAR_11230 [Mycolicibacterium sarraceniae]|uniref:AraC family transcriptional regulator n=1 Tax=Mycolicibacterium sarraceniae TaxID=1534348 RepID=A0A7I7SLW2_9MYCO|nr:hypothetical protein MSAR_11230 [Mycolicibacterium sarraceniae]